jgi:hypothetical protein
MKHIKLSALALLTFIALLHAIFNFTLNAQEFADKSGETKIDDGYAYFHGGTVKLPVNVYDTFMYSENVRPYMRVFTYASGPAFFLVYGAGLWQWFEDVHFHLKPETFKGPQSVNGAADKVGHLWGNYMGKRLFTFLFHATGSSRNRANIEGAILMSITSLGGEFGDGISPHYGFDPYDVMFNEFGVIIAMILDYSPTLDRIFAPKWEYWPSSYQRKRFSNPDHWDIATDYSDQKYILATKLGGIPYLSRTPLRYFNIDFGYYTRGYRPAVIYKNRTRNVFFGFSVNFTIAFGDLLPAGYASSTVQTFFNYYHPPCDFEAKVWELSNEPQREFE